MGTDPKQPSKKGFTVNDRRWWLKEDAESGDIPDQPEISKPTYVEELEAQLAEKDKTLREYIQAHKSSVTGMDETRARLGTWTGAWTSSARGWRVRSWKCWTI